MPGRQQVDPVGVGGDDAVARREPELAQAGTRRPAVVGQVVEGHQDRRAPHDRIVGVASVAEDRRRAAVPVVQVQHVDGPAVGAQASRAARQNRPNRQALSA